MSFVTLEQLYQDYPLLEDIAIRLDLSKTEAEKKAKEKKPIRSNEPGEEHQVKTSRGSNAPVSEHALIDKFLKDGKWVKTYHALQSGREPFETNLQRIMARGPQALSILIVKGSRLNAASKPDKIEVKIDKNLENLPDSSKNDDDNNLVLDTIKTQLGTLQEQMKSNPQVKTDAEGQSTIANLNFAQQITEIKHAHEIQTLKADHKYEVDTLHREYEGRIDELEETIEDLEYEIEELEAEKAEAEASLSGVDKKIEEAENPSWVKMLGKVGKSAIEHFAKEHADGLGKIFNVDTADIKKYFAEKSTEEQNKVENKTTTVDFSPANDSENETYSKLDAEKKQFADAFIDIVSSVATPDLKILAGAFKHALNDDGTLNSPVLEAMFNAAISTKESQVKNKTNGPEENAGQGNNNEN